MAAALDAQSRARTFIASSAPAVSQSAGDWVEIKDPAELRALYSNTTFRGKGINPPVSFVGHYSADGRGVSNFLGRTVPRTWVVNGDQVSPLTIIRPAVSGVIRPAVAE